MSERVPKILVYYIGILLIIAGIIAIFGQIYNIYIIPSKKQIPPDLFNYTIIGSLVLGVVLTLWGRSKGVKGV